MITPENLENYTSDIVYCEIKNDYFKLLLFISNFNICGVKSLQRIDRNSSRIGLSIYISHKRLVDDFGPAVKKLHPCRTG